MSDQERSKGSTGPLLAPLGHTDRLSSVCVSVRYGRPRNGGSGVRERKHPTHVYVARKCVKIGDWREGVCVCVGVPID